MPERQPLPHRGAWWLASHHVRGASWYWRVAGRLARTPGRSLVELPDGSRLAFDPADWIALNTYRGLYERAERAVVAALLRPGDHVVDVGANIGVFTLLASDRVGPDGRVVAVEPSPRCHPLLDLAVGAARHPNISVHAVAVGDVGGTAVLRGHERPSHAGGGSLRDDMGDDDGVEVPVVRLDALLVEERVEEVAVLKVDVEGYEPQVLDGLGGLDGRVRHALIELTPDFGTTDWGADLLRRAGDLYVAHAVGERRSLVGRPELVPLTPAEIAGSPTQVNVLFSRRDVAGALPFRR